MTGHIGTGDFADCDLSNQFLSSVQKHSILRNECLIVKVCRDLVYIVLMFVWCILVNEIGEGILDSATFDPFNTVCRLFKPPCYVFQLLLLPVKKDNDNMPMRFF